MLDNIRVTSSFGKRKDPDPNIRKVLFHSGVDLSASVGTPIYAIADGVVKVSKCVRGGKKVGYGFYAVIEHDGFCTLIAHLNNIELKVGQQVNKGDVISYTGNTGRCFGAHLHLEIRKCKYDHLFFTKDKDGMYYKAVDPIKFMEEMSYPQWQEDLIKWGMDNDLLSDYHKPDEPVNMWVLMSVIKNLKKGL